MRRLLMHLLPWRRRTYRLAVAELHRWQREDREIMAQYCPKVRDIIADDGGRKCR
jgi:hypothetical protein